MLWDQLFYCHVQQLPALMHFCLRPSVAKSFPTFREFTFFEHVNYIVKYATNTLLFNQQLYAKSNSSYYKTKLELARSSRSDNLLLLTVFLIPKTPDFTLSLFLVIWTSLKATPGQSVLSLQSSDWILKTTDKTVIVLVFLADVDEQIHGPMEKHSALWKSYTFNNASKTLKIELESVNFTMLCKLTKK